MSTTSSIKRNPIALNLPQSVPLLIVFGRRVVLAMTGNAWLPNPAPSLTDVSAHIDALEAAEVTAQSRAKGTAAARNLKKKVVQDDLMSLKACVMQAVNQHPDQAAAIIESAGMARKRFTPSPKPELDARMGSTPGEVLLRAKAVRRRAAYEWQLSGDGGATWTTTGTTTVANARVLALQVGKTYVFRFRTTVQQVTGDWSQALSFLVH